MIDYRGYLARTLAYEILLSAQNAGKLSHCYLLLSSDADAAAALCDLVVTRSYCKSLCGVCADCKRIAAHAHPDIFRFEGKLLAEQVDAIIACTEYLPSEGDKRFIIVKNVETITPALQSKLLKSLEEPPRDTHYFLIADSEDNVVSTVRSRSTCLILPPPASSEVGSMLAAAGYPPERAGFFAGVCAQGAGEARRFLEDKRGEERIAAAFAVLEGTGSGEVTALSANLAALPEPKMTLTILGGILRDVLAARTGAELLLNCRKNDILKVADGFSPRALVRALDAVDRALYRLKFNGNPTSVADELVFTILEVKALCR